MQTTYDEKIFRNLFLGFIRIHILCHASKERIFGLDMIKELGRHGYHLSPGTLYPILHQLEKNGFLSSERAINDGKYRKYYRTTDEGNKALAQAHQKIGELTRELTA